MRVFRFAKLFFILLFFIFPIFGKTEVFFSPDDRPEKHLLSLIENAKSKIYAAVFLITNQKIVNSLMFAKKNGVDVQIIIDETSINNENGKVHKLVTNNVPVFVFDASSKKNNLFVPKMHNKFAVIDGKVWTGSFNWTHSANFSNQENVVLIDEKFVLKKYEKQFEILKKRSHEYKSCFMKKNSSKQFTQNYVQSNLRSRVIQILRAIKNSKVLPYP